MLQNKAIKSRWLWLGFLFLTGCLEPSYEELKSERTDIANKSKDATPIIVGVSWTDKDDAFIDGVKLAVKEINAKGGVLNSPLEIIVNDGESVFDDAGLSEAQRQSAILNIARSFAANPNLISVIGHSSSSIAILASVVYQNTGVLFLAPNSRYSKLTGHNFDYTFRTLLNNDESAMQIADYTAQQNFKNIAVLYSRDASSSELADAFSTYAVDKHDINIVYQGSFFENTLNPIPLIVALKNIQQLDAIFIAATGEKSAEIYELGRTMGLKIPFIGGANLDTQVFMDKIKEWEYAKDIKKSIISTRFNTTIPKSQAFINRFKQEYGQDVEPDYLAVLGYDTVTLLAHGIQLAQSRIPIEIATALRYMDVCKGVAGPYEFLPNGDLKIEPLWFKQFAKNDYVYEHVKNDALAYENTLETCNDIDRDHDMVPDKVDACPDSKAEEMVKGIMFEGANRGCPTDSDKDNLPDYKDNCPNNLNSEIAEGVDALGCPVDSDNDQIPDYSDSDMDGDKVANIEDQCPKNTAKEQTKGINLSGKQMGCPIDTDADLVKDYLDTCPKNTVIEISQGVDSKGCPADSDDDRVLDFEDNCLKTPAEVLIDKQGCEIINTTTSKKPITHFFATKEFSLAKPGMAYLDRLLEHSDLQLLKKIQIIGYAAQKDIELSQNRLQSITGYLQQKGISVEKMEVIVRVSLKNVSTKKSEFTPVNAKSAINSIPKITAGKTENPTKNINNKTPTIKIETYIESNIVKNNIEFVLLQLNKRH